jgi:hypothetical protein
MDPVTAAKTLLTQSAELFREIRLARDRLYAQRIKARQVCAQARSLRPQSPHDLIPLDMATALIFRRVYEERMQLGTPGRLTAHLDGLAYTLAELAPIYVYERNGQGVRALSKEELAGALFQDGARAISYVDGRATLKNLAMSTKHIPGVVQTLIASSPIREER